MTAGRNTGSDLRDEPNYSVAEAARWLGLVPGTLRSWALGHTYPTREGPKRAPAVIKPAAKGPLELSFWNLVECNVLAAMRRVHGVSFQKVRRALKFVEKRLGKPRPLIQQRFATDGVNLFIEAYEGKDRAREAPELLSVSEAGQLTMRHVLEECLTRIDPDPAGLAMRLYPWSNTPSEPKVVAVDVNVSFGRPVLAETSVPVEVILQRFRAGDTIEQLAADYRVDHLRVENVLRWAAGGTAAA